MGSKVDCTENGWPVVALAKEWGYRGKGNDPARWLERLPCQFPQRAA